MAGRRVTNAAGSSNALRGDGLRVLGVLKVATADQIQRLSSPHLSFRHTLGGPRSGRKRAPLRTEPRPTIYGGTVCPRMVAAPVRGRRCAY